jgi:hypothetical protein
MSELGLLEEFLSRPHQEVRRLSVEIGREQLTLADFSHLPTHCRFVVSCRSGTSWISSPNRRSVGRAFV